jgi:hypothetical protein
MESEEGGVHAVINKDPVFAEQIDDTHAHLGQPPISVTRAYVEMALHDSGPGDASPCGVGKDVRVMTSDSMIFLQTTSTGFRKQLYPFPLPDLLQNQV